MKRQLGALIFFFTAALLFTGCKKESVLGSFTADIDGQSWSALLPNGFKTGNRITITGLSLNKQIILNINGTAPGTYDMSLINGDIQPFVYTPDVTVQGAQQSYAGTSGSIVVTEVADSRLSGNFNVTASNGALDIISISGEFRNITFL